jgi:hypothetical protein
MRNLLDARVVGLALGLALMLGCFPSVAEARMVDSMPAGHQSTGAREASLAKINRLLAEDAVAETLAEHGLTTEQIKSRLDRLTDEQLEELSQHLETIEKGQGSSSLLVLAGAIIVLVVVLIYMLIEQA